jgi:HEAT repeat protein
MPETPYEEIKTLLESNEPDDLRQGLELVRQEISRVGSREAKPLFEMVSALFYIDPLDQPHLVPILNQAISLIVGFGNWVIPILVEDLDAGDLKAQTAISQALGRIGADAIEPLIAEYHASTDPGCRSFVLFTLGKIKSPKILQAAHVAIDACESEDVELRDTGARAIGKFVECISPSELPADLKAVFMEKLRQNLADTNPGIRAKAVRSWGKLARYGHLDGQERAKLRDLCQLLLGRDPERKWDRAYIVRKQAEEALRYT